jgi:hypothetical protein
MHLRVCSKSTIPCTKMNGDQYWLLVAIPSPTLRCSKRIAAMKKKLAFTDRYAWLGRPRYAIKTWTATIVSFPSIHTIFLLLIVVYAFSTTIHNLALLLLLALQGHHLCFGLNSWQDVSNGTSTNVHECQRYSLTQITNTAVSDKHMIVAPEAPFIYCSMSAFLSVYLSVCLSVLFPVCPLCCLSVHYLVVCLSVH